MHITMRGLFLMVVASLIVGCDQDLTRSSAKDVLVSALEMPKPVELNVKKTHFVQGQGAVVNAFGMTAICSRSNTMGEFRHSNELLSKFVERGLVVLKSRSERQGNCTNQLVEVVLTEKGRDDLMREDETDFYVRRHHLMISDVTGIVLDPEGMLARVEFTVVKNNPTAFEIEVDNEATNRVETLARYDDGWRLVKR